MPAAFLEAAYGRCNFPVLVTDPGGTLRYANSSAEVQLGLGQAVGEPVWDLLTITRPDVSLEAVHRFARTTGRWDGHVFLKTAGAQTVAGRWSLSALLLPDGSQAFLSVVTVDQGASRDLFSTVMESIQVGVLARSADTRLLYINPLLRTLSGYDGDGIADLDAILEKIHPADQAKFAAAWDAAFREREDQVAEFRGILADGNLRWLRNEMFWSPDRETVVGLIYDVHDRKEAQAALQRAHDELEGRVRERTSELEAAKRALEADIEARVRAEHDRDRFEKELRRSQTLEAVGRLAGGVAHDFNNLLGGVLGCLYAARMEARGNPAVLEELERAQGLCRRGGEMTRQLLTVARKRAGREESIPVAGLMEETRAFLERTLPKHIRLSFQAEKDLPRVRGDGSLLTSALLNLGLNARDAMPRGGTLTLAARKIAFGGGRGGVELEVSDTGCGMPRELQDKIFEPFFTTKGPDEGSGMGLAMAYATVKECGGEITLRSEPGQGASFLFRLPAEERPSRPIPGSPGFGAGGHPLAEGPILVVEDEAEVARMITGVLVRHGYETLEAATGLEALEAVRNHRDTVALVLLDLMLPELGGEDVYRFLKALAPDLPVLFTTGREDLARKIDPRAPLLPKPFGDRELLGALGAVFAPTGATCLP